MSKVEMRKVVTLTSPPVPKYRLDMLKVALFPENEKDVRGLDWYLNEDRSLDLFTE